MSKRRELLMVVQPETGVAFLTGLAVPRLEAPPETALNWAIMLVEAVSIAVILVECLSLTAALPQLFLLIQAR